MRKTLKQTSLPEWLTLLEKRHPNAIDLGLYRVSQVAERLNVLEQSALIISIAGTNGKGSCVAFLESMLLADNYCVGSYTSPHLSVYNERICIAARPVDDRLICSAFTEIEQARGDISLTYFEFATLAALLIFKQQKVDVALLEVGLGGRLDAVNIVDADVAVITSIDLDHQDWLGNDREAIGVEKAGIARQGRPLICGDSKPPATLLNCLEDLETRNFMLGTEAFNYLEGEQTLNLNCTDLTDKAVHYTDLPHPQLPFVSAVVAVQALICAGRTPTQKIVSGAFSETHLAGRFQSVRFRHRDVILDVAHNPAAAQLLADRLAYRYDIYANTHAKKRVYGLFGVLADKDIEGIVAPLLAVIENWHVCDLSGVARAASAEDISSVVKKHGTSVQKHDSVASGLLSIIAEMKSEDVLIIFGSFYTVAEALELINGE